MDRGLMLNDGDCGFCMRTAELVLCLGVDIDSSTVQAVDLAALGVDEKRALAEVPYVHPDGRVDYGHRAVASILGTGPLPWRLIGRFMTTRPVARSRDAPTTGWPPTARDCPAGRPPARLTPAESAAGADPTQGHSRCDPGAIERTLPLASE